MGRASVYDGKRRIVTTSVDFDFVRYVAAANGEAAARLREGAAYAYGGDLKVRAALDRVKPVTLALEAGVRFWNSVGKNQLLANAVRVGEKQFPEVAAVVESTARTLQIDAPAVYVSPGLGGMKTETLGTSGEVVVVLGTGLAKLPKVELSAVLGHAYGHIQNNHVPYLTALYLLSKAGNQIVRWAAQPAILGLRGWARRAEITCDRAALLCARDLNATIAVMVKRALGSEHFFANIDLDEYLRQIEQEDTGRRNFAELTAQNPALPKRVKALRLFAETTYYRSVVGQSATAETPGLTKEACDAEVSELLAVLG